MSCRVALAFACAILLAGCLASPESKLDAATSMPEQPANVAAFSSCSEMTGRYPIPLEEVQAALPQGFEAIQGGPTGNSGLLFVPVYFCEAVGVDGSLERVQEAQVMIVTTPPAELALDVDGFHSHGFLIDWVTTSTLASTFYTSWGAPHHLDDISFELLARTPAVPAVRATMTSDSGGALAVDSMVKGPYEPFGGGTVRVFYEVAGAQEGRLRAVDVAWEGIPNTGFGLGSFQREGETPILSTDVFQAWAYEWTMTFLDFDSELA